MQIDALHVLKFVLVRRRIAKLLICDDVRPRSRTRVRKQTSEIEAVFSH